MEFFHPLHICHFLCVISTNSQAHKSHRRTTLWFLKVHLRLACAVSREMARSLGCIIKLISIEVGQPVSLVSVNGQNSGHTILNHVGILLDVSHLLIHTCRVFDVPISKLNNPPLCWIKSSPIWPSCLCHVCINPRMYWKCFDASS